MAVHGRLTASQIPFNHLTIHLFRHRFLSHSDFADPSIAGHANADFFLKKSFVFIRALVAFNRQQATAQILFNHSTIQPFTYLATAPAEAG